MSRWYLLFGACLGGGFWCLGFWSCPSSSGCGTDRKYQVTNNKSQTNHKHTQIPNQMGQIIYLVWYLLFGACLGGVFCGLGFCACSSSSSIPGCPARLAHSCALPSYGVQFPPSTAYGLTPWFSTSLLNKSRNILYMIYRNICFL